MLAGRQPTDSLPPGINLPPIDDQRKALDSIKRFKDDFRRHDSRAKLLEKMIPKFYHRNDATKVERIKDTTNNSLGVIPGERQIQTQANGQNKDALSRHRDDAKPHKLQLDSTEHPVDEKSSTHDTSQEAVSQETVHEAKTASQRPNKGISEQQRHEEGHSDKSPESKSVAVDEDATFEKVNEKIERPNKEEKGSVSEEGNHAEEAIHGVKTGPDHEDSHIALKEASEKATEKEALSLKGETNNTEIKADRENQSQIVVPLRMRANGLLLNRTLLNMDSIPNQSQCPGSVTSLRTTLVIQCSLDRMWILQETCRRWHDPIVVVVDMTSEDQSFEKWKTLCPQLTIISYVAGSDEKEWRYPVNRLRNLGLDIVKTSHVIVVDVDFVPSEGLDQTIRSVLEERQRQRQVVHSEIPDEDRDAIVIPAFERVEDCLTINCSQFLQTNSSFIPRNMEELRDCMKEQKCAVFQSKNNWEGHFSTQSHKWLNGEFYDDKNVTLADKSTSMVIKRVPCFDSLRYEPYVVIRWCSSSSQTKPSAPYYDERFYGYGKNKIQLISHIRFLGYQFSILPHGFVVHNPHTDSSAKQVWNDVQDYKLHETMDALYPQFLNELYEKYQHETDPRTIVQQCRRDKKKHT